MDLKHCNDTRAFIEYYDMNDTNEFNSTNISKITIVFDDMIAALFSNKKPYLIVTESFIRGGKLNISIIFVTRYYFAVPKNIRLNSIHYFIMKIPKFNMRTSTMLTYKDFMNFTKYVLQNHIISWETVEFCHQIILYVLDAVS